MKKNVLVIIISAAIIILGAAIAYYLISNKPQPQPPKKLETVRYATMDEVNYAEYDVSINTTGSVRAKNKLDIYSEVQGIYSPSGKEFREGVRFSKGEPMIVIDKREAELTLKTQKSELMNAIASLMADIKVDFPESFDKWNNYLSKFDIEKSVEELPKPSSDKEKYFLTVRNIYKLYFNIKNQEVRLSKHIITAPYTGTVAMSSIEPGALVRPGAKLGEFSGLNLFEVSLAIRAEDLKYIKVGSSVDIIHEDNKLSGKVVRISNRIDPTTQSVNAYVSVSSIELKDGMYVSGEISGNKVTDVYKLPRKALIDNREVYTVVDGKLDKEEIELIYLGKNNAYIRGLAAGTIVIAEPMANVKLGTKIKRNEN
ncbi:MAG: efflux RND transporter periplasmic adaptor subunit [Chlorobiota bacterium]